MASQRTTHRTGTQVNLGMGLHVNLTVGFDRATQRVSLDLEIHHQCHRHPAAPLHHQMHRLNIAVDVDGGNNRNGQEVAFQRELPRLSRQTNANSGTSQDQSRDLQYSRPRGLTDPNVIPSVLLTSPEGGSEPSAPLGPLTIGDTHFEPRILQTPADAAAEPVASLSTISTAEKVFEYIKSLPSPSLTNLAADCGTCHICLEPLHFVKLPCGHHFGAECIIRWLTPTENAQNNTCPICRTVLFEKEEPELPRRVIEIERLLDLGEQLPTGSQFNNELMDVLRQDIELRMRLTRLAELDYLHGEQWRLGTIRALQEDDMLDTRMRQFHVQYRATIEILEGVGASHTAQRDFDSARASV